MGDLGFWALAHENPAHLALVGPDGTEYTAGELLGRTNQVVHGLRRLGWSPVTWWPPSSPTGSRCSSSTWPPCRPAGTWSRSTTTWSAPRSPTSSRTPGPRSSSPTSGSPRWRLDAAAEAELAASALPRRRRDRRLRLLCRRADGRADRRSSRPHHRRRHELHLGHHRQPQGGAPAARAAPSPRTPPSGCPASSSSSASSPRTTTSTSWARPSTTPPCCASRGASIHLGHTVVVHGQVGRPRRCSAHRALQGHHLPHGAHPVPPAAGPARGDPRPLRHVVPAPHDPRRRSLPCRRQAQDDRLVGQRHRRVLRRLGGRWHPGHRRGVAEQARDGGQAVADLGDRHLRRRGQSASRSRT